MSYEKAFTKAKFDLMKRPKTVFYTTILFSLKTVWDKNIGTAGVNSKTLVLNPDWFLDLSPEERIGLLVHEIRHIVHNHITRKGLKDPIIFNMAGDYVINNSLIEEKYVLPANGLSDPKYTGMSTEQVYYALLAEYQHTPPSSIPGTGQDIQYSKAGVDEYEQQQQIKAIILRAVHQAAKVNEQPGELSGSLQLLLDQLLNPKLPWDTILAMYLLDYQAEDYSWNKPNRRYLPNYLPTRHNEGIVDLVIAVDISGSVSMGEFNYFITEIDTIKNTLKPNEIKLLIFDTEIHSEDVITQSTELLTDLTFTGRGGTEIAPIFQWATDNQPMILLVFTDGDFYWPTIDTFPECDIIWLIHNNPTWTAPLGKVIHYDINF